MTFMSLRAKLKVRKISNPDSKILKHVCFVFFLMQDSTPESKTVYFTFGSK